MSNQELESVLAMIEETRGGDRSNNPLWFERNGVDVVGMNFPMPEEPIEITQVRANGVPGLCFTPSDAMQGSTFIYAWWRLCIRLCTFTSSPSCCFLLILALLHFLSITEWHPNIHFQPQ